MKREDFDRRVKPYLNAAYKNMFPVERSIEVWYESLRGYDINLIEDAIRRYIPANRFKPVPADIIKLLPSANPMTKFQPRDDGTVQCTRCGDSGLYVWEDEEGRKVGVPCDCPAGHDKFHWGWLTEEEKKSYISRAGYHDENMSEDWYSFWRRV